MEASTKYKHLEARADKSSPELFIKGTGIRASTIWSDRYVNRLSPEKIARDRDIALDAVHEALDYCRESWEAICDHNDHVSDTLDRKGFFEAPSSDRE